MTDKLVYDVDLAKDVKLLASVNPDVTFIDNTLKNKLFDNIKDNDLVRVGKSIGSLKIVSIDVLDKKFLGEIFEVKWVVKVVLPSRIVCTKEFYDKILSKDYGLLDNCIRININSKEHKRDHIVISKKDFEQILKDNPNIVKYTDVLMAALKRKDEPEEIEAESDEITRTIQYAIYFSSKEPPFSSVILTTKESIKKYQENNHYKNMKNVDIKPDEDEINLLKTFHTMCMDKDYY